MKEAIKKTVWVTGGCTSWYMDKSGTPNLYPWFPARYLREMHRPEYSEYRLIK
jgi:cyclohexanone monooxygenase